MHAQGLSSVTKKEKKKNRNKTKQKKSRSNSGKLYTYSLTWKGLKKSPSAHNTHTPGPNSSADTAPWGRQRKEKTDGRIPQRDKGAHPGPEPGRSTNPGKWMFPMRKLSGIPASIRHGYCAGVCNGNVEVCWGGKKSSHEVEGNGKKSETKGT